MKFLVQNKTLLTYGLTLVNLLVIVLFSLLGTVNKNHVLQDNTSLNLINLMDKIYMDLARSEAEVNNYLFTSELEYIDRYKKTRAPLEENMLSLGMSLRNTETQKKKYATLKNLIERHIYLLETSIEQRKANGMTSATEFLEKRKSFKRLEEIGSLQKALIEEQKGMIINQQKRLELSIKSREYIIVSASIASLLISIIAIGTIVTDLNEKREREKYLQAINDNKDRFFTLISHDLKGPAHNLIGISDILLNDKSLTTEENSTFLSHLNVTAKKNYTLLENLLEWSRIQMGSLSIMPEKINLWHVTEDVLIMHTDKILEKKIHLHNHINRELIAEADINCVKSVLRNLITNALKFTPAGGTIDINAIAGSTYITLSVKDSGIGMDQTTKNNLFLPGRMVSRYGTEGEPGSGIGLLLCKEFITRNKGKIWVESEAGAGTCFYFTLLAVQVQIDNAINLTNTAKLSS